MFSASYPLTTYISETDIVPRSCLYTLWYSVLLVVHHGSKVGGLFPFISLLYIPSSGEVQAETCLISNHITLAPPLLSLACIGLSDDSHLVVLLPLLLTLSTISFGIRLIYSPTPCDTNRIVIMIEKVSRSQSYSLSSTNQVR